jgi:hypothetical protein
LLETPPKGGSFVQRSVKLAKAVWRELEFEPGKLLRIGPDLATPTGNITAFGIYVERRAGFKLRYDTVQIDAVPTVRAAYRNISQQTKTSPGARP